MKCEVRSTKYEVRGNYTVQFRPEEERATEGGSRAAISSLKTPAASTISAIIAGSRYRIEPTKIMCKSAKYGAGSQHRTNCQPRFENLTAPHRPKNKSGT